MNNKGLMNNKRASVLIYGIMLGLTILILGLALSPVLAEFTNSAMNPSNGDTIGLDCSNDSISDFDKATCVATDLSLLYFMGTVIFIAGAVVTARVVFQ